LRSWVRFEFGRLMRSVIGGTQNLAHTHIILCPHAHSIHTVPETTQCSYTHTTTLTYLGSDVLPLESVWDFNSLSSSLLSFMVTHHRLHFQ
jgi:hypothetical protein